ncbi:MAG: cytochrome c [Bacteroidales bacterium]|nr:cytochrome c [Bacteroidales bacterium]
MIRYLLKILLVIVSVSALISCDRDKNNPGYNYFPDMTYSRAYETYTPNSNFADGKTMREPAEGTIPRGFLPFPYEKSEEDMIRAGKELTNPLEKSDKNLERGKLIFQRYCLQCHGEKGDGKGLLFTSGRYPFPPATLISEKMINKPDGEIFHAVTLGFGIMGPHGLLLTPEDRWKVILYIRDSLQVQ